MIGIFGTSLRPGILHCLVALIMQCVSTVQYKICFNGELTDKICLLFSQYSQCCQKGNQFHLWVSPTNNLGKYLGMPLIHSRVTKATQMDIIQKGNNRLASWKSKVLSMAGRLTLIQSVTSAIPLYAMQTTKLPAIVCENLDKLNKNFLWCDNDRQRKVHLYRWNLMCRLKNKGDLGLKKATHMSQALLAKVGWRIHSKSEGLWSCIYQHKYLKGRQSLTPLQQLSTPLVIPGTMCCMVLNY